MRVRTAAPRTSTSFARDTTSLLRYADVRGVHVPRCTAATVENARRILRNDFELIGEAYRLDEGFSWRVNPSHDKEWQIAQHKHYWAVDLLHAWRATADAAYLKKWIALTSSWLDEMGTGFITASDAQVEAKRVEHWVYAYALLRAHPVANVPAALLARFLDRLADETRYIATHLKPARNHRTFQLFAVCLSAITFAQYHADGELARFGVEQLTANLLTDILSDGVQVEQSTHYHQLVLETAVSFLELTRANGIAVDRALDRRVAAALRFALHVQWPDGHLPLLNDSDDGVQTELLRRGAALFGDQELLWGGTLGREGMPPRDRSVLFADSGYFVLRDGWGHDAATLARRQHVTYDCGRLGEGSHSHYDIFNFTFYANGAPLVVDPGRYTYSSEIRDGVDWRHWFKSTAAHNTITIDALDQTRYLSRTKHGPDAQVRDREYLLGVRTDWVRAAIDSHEYAPRHERFFLYMAREYLWIVDRVDPADAQPHEAVLRFHLSDALRPSAALRSGPRGAELQARDLIIAVHTDRPALSAIEPGWVSTRYGIKRAAPVMAVAQFSDTPMTFCSVVSACSGSGLPRVLWTSEAQMLRADIDGIAGSYHDTHVTALTAALPTCQVPGLTCCARHVSFRRDAHGRVVYVVASGAACVDVEGVPLDIGESGAVEWSRETRS